VIEDCGVTGTPNKITSGLPISPGERYDVIVDFSDLPGGTVVQLKNSKSDTYDVMHFIVNANLCGDGSGGKPIGSTSPYDLKLKPRENLGALTSTQSRDLSLTVNEKDAVLIGVNASYYGSKLGQLWSDPITENPEADAIEIWEYWNFFQSLAHPMHVHLAKFEIVERCALPTVYPYTGELQDCYAPYPWETGFKDIVLCNGNEICRIKLQFDGKGVYMHHCHFIIHEDNEMMRPFCIGEVGKDCSPDFF